MREVSIKSEENSEDYLDSIRSKLLESVEQSKLEILREDLELIAPIKLNDIDQEGKMLASAYNQRNLAVINILIEYGADYSLQIPREVFVFLENAKQLNRLDLNKDILDEYIVERSLDTDSFKKALFDNLCYYLAFNPEITLLNLSNNGLEEVFFSKFLHMREIANNDFISLNFAGNKIDNNCLLYLAAIISKSQNLQHLNLARNNFALRDSFASESKFYLLVDAIQNHVSLLFLNLRKNKLNDQYIEGLSNIMHNPKLLSLNLANNSFTKDNIAGLFPVLANNFALQYLDLSDLIIGNQVFLLLDQLAQNNNLLCLGLHNAIRDENSTHDFIKRITNSTQELPYIILTKNNAEKSFSEIEIKALSSRAPELLLKIETEKKLGYKKCVEDNLKKIDVKIAETADLFEKGMLSLKLAYFYADNSTFLDEFKALKYLQQAASYEQPSAKFLLDNVENHNFARLGKIEIDKIKLESARVIIDEAAIIHDHFVTQESDLESDIDDHFVTKGGDSESDYEMVEEGFMIVSKTRDQSQSQKSSSSDCKRGSAHVDQIVQDPNSDIELS